MAEADPVLKQKGSSVTDFPAPVPRRKPERRGKAKAGAWSLMLAVPLALALAGLVYWMYTRGTASTDNATINQDIVSVSSDVSGRIVEVAVHENQQVKAGDLLFRVDPEPYRVALAQRMPRLRRRRSMSASFPPAIAALQPTLPRPVRT
jgi:membrane fusion protein (multidrug efflux system)